MGESATADCGARPGFFRQFFPAMSSPATRSFLNFERPVFIFRQTVEPVFWICDWRLAIADWRFPIWKTRSPERYWRVEGPRSRKFQSPMIKHQRNSEFQAPSLIALGALSPSIGWYRFLPVTKWFLIRF